ncbi:MAG: hypothetical protein CL572_03800 [Alphaproteobacteria bacterium]|nr:hypothetical protein [Alphaproteobacteria bacterium]|tara:strand:+ start:256 stop:660 length:405 start_codon:yes stop_codon:yes gene_type:complete
MKSFFLLALIFLLGSSLSLEANEPYDNNLAGKKLICFTDSDSIEDWGIKFLSNKRVVLYSLDKFIFEIYEHKRSYKTDLRNIKIYNGKDIDFLINRETLRFGNKKCKITNVDPLYLLKSKIEDIKKSKAKKNIL